MINTTLSGNKAPTEGGGIHNSGFAKITNSLFFENEALRGGAIHNNAGTTEISDSVLLENKAMFNGGGIVVNVGVARVIGSTISGNSSNGTGGGTGGGIGGGIFVAEDGMAQVVHSTVYQNSSNENGGGIFNSGTLEISNSTLSKNFTGSAHDGGGIYHSGDAAQINNSIVANSTNGGDLFADDGKNFEGAFNLIGDGSHLGDFDSAVEGDPMLADLADNGGSTETHVLLLGSPAINAGDPEAMVGDGTTPHFDQRGSLFSRVAFGRMDIGAVEFQPTAPPALEVNTIDDVVNIDDSALSLREAIHWANIPDLDIGVDDNSITFFWLSV